MPYLNKALDEGLSLKEAMEILEVDEENNKICRQ